MSPTDFFVNISEAVQTANTLKNMDSIEVAESLSYSDFLRVKKDTGSPDDDANDMINRYVEHKLSRLGTTSFMISKKQLDDYSKQGDPADPVVAYQFLFARNNDTSDGHTYGRMTIILVAVADSGKHVYFRNLADQHDYVLEHCLPCPGTGCPMERAPGEPVLEGGQ